MIKWWSNQEPLTEPEARLVAALYSAHSQCVFRPNCSTAACQQAAGGSRSLPQSIIAALACLGDMHGPIEEAYDVLSSVSHHEFPSFLQPGHPVKLAGWGNSFIKGQIDPAFVPVDQCLEANFPRTHNTIREITQILHSNGKHIFPNPACYSAATALILGMPRHLNPLLFIQARVEAWASVFHHTVLSLEKPKKEKEAA